MTDDVLYTKSCACACVHFCVFDLSVCEKEQEPLEVLVAQGSLMKIHKIYSEVMYGGSTDRIWK